MEKFDAIIISFFENSGLKLKVERRNRVFPASDKSPDVLNVLKSKLEDKNINVFTRERAREIIIKNKKIEGVVTYSRKYFSAQRVALTTGGLSYPGTGSTGDGYRMAEKSGHEIIPLKPALSPDNMQAAFSTGWVCGDNI